MPKRRSAKPKTLLAQRLIDIRERYGALTRGRDMDQKEYAMDILGFAEEQVEAYRRYERGDVQPSLQLLADIHRVTGASLDELIPECFPPLSRSRRLGERPTSSPPQSRKTRALN
jgi:transcriptional regulator with XRE-family HTH domain